MADNNIVYKISVDSESGTATIRDLKGQIVATQVPVNKLKENFNNLTVSINKNKNATDGNVVAHKNSELTLNAEISKLNSLRSALDISSKEYVEMGNTIDLLNQKKASLRRGTEGLTKTQSQLQNATGGATAAAMELGRVVSDAPYGIRGMANNVSQLASQLFYMAGQQVTATTATNTDTVAKGANTTATVVSTGATIGFTGALKMMWSALMGPLGVLLAIQAVIAAFDFFYGSNKKAEDSVGDLNKAIGGTAGINTKLLAYSEIIKTSNKDTKEYKNALKELKSKGYDPASESLDNFINKQLKLLVIRAKSKVIEDELNKLFTEQVTKESKLREQQQRIDALEIKKDKEKNKVKRDRIQNNIDYIESQKEVVVVDEKYKKLQKELIALTTEEFKLIDNITKNGKGKPKLLEFDDFDKQAEDYLDKIASVSEKEEILNAELNSDKVLIQERYHLERLKATHLQNQSKFKQQADAYRIEYKAFLDQQVRMTDLTKEEAKVKLDDFDKSTKSEQKKSEDNYKILIEKWKSYYFDKVFIALQAEQKIKDSKKTESETEFKELDKLKIFVDNYKIIMSGLTEFIDGEFERQLTIEQNKTNVLNKELNDRLLNENLSSDQRKSIQNEIAQNDERLRVRQEAIKKKAFNTQKAFNISSALVETYAAASSAYRNTLAQPINIADPTVGLVRAKKNAAIAMAGGLLQVAAIARQKYQSSSANTPINTTGGGGGGTTERADPSFNIVGRSGDNLLINAIQAQFDKPLKAYVVSRDVTNQQQLDGMIVSQAGT